jgi:hypothetical protein
MKDRLLSLEWWTKVFATFAAIGIILGLVGRIAKLKTMMLVGAWLGAPLFVLAGLLVVVGIPYILLEGRGQRGNK